MKLREAASTYLSNQDWAAAWQVLLVLLTYNPRNAWALQWQVVAAMGLNRPEQAVVAAQRALKTMPQTATRERADVAFNLGQAHGALGEPAEALAAFDTVLALVPHHSPAQQGRAKALQQLGEHAQAGRAATLALAAHPGNLEALSVVANSLLMAQALPEALGRFLTYERAKPASPFTACMVVFLMRQLADWGMPPLPVNAEESQMLPAAVARGEHPALALLAHRAWRNMPALESFASLVLFDDPALQRHAAQQLLQHMHPPQEQPPTPAPALPQLLPQAMQPSDGAAPLRVAYVSSEFNEHATAYLLAGVLARHSRERVQVFLLSFAAPRSGKASGQPDAMQQRIQAMGHTWVDVHAWPDAQVAQWCRSQGIQVAVDLKGLTRDSRPGIFAHRAAPVQVNWLGYPGSLPAPYYDWVLADAQVLPPALEPHFAERVWRMPHSYQPNDPDRMVDPTPQHRRDHGLPDTGTVLVCFNNTFKFTPEVWAMWMRFLKADPQAVLWLLQGHPQASDNLRRHAQAQGVAPERLVFAPQLPQAQHLARLQLASLSLETWPYNAHTTASDALWAGVPHFTVPGRSFASRVGASVLTAVGMPECICPSLAAYQARVLALLAQPTQLQQLHDHVLHQRHHSALFDAAGFAHDLEDALQGMWAAGSMG